MASFVEELVDNMVTAGLATTKGTDIFYNAMPDISADPTIVVYDMGGEPSRCSPSPWLDVSVVVRGSTWEIAREAQANIYNRYHEATELSLSSFTIKAAFGESLPMSEGEDGRRRHITRANYKFKVVVDDQTGGSTTGYGGKKDPNCEIS